MKHVLRVVNALAAVVIVVALVVLLRATFTPAGEVPTIGGYGILRTLTGSMEPAIPVHSLVVVTTGCLQVSAAKLMKHPKAILSRRSSGWLLPFDWCMAHSAWRASLSGCL